MESGYPTAINEKTHIDPAVEWTKPFLLLTYSHASPILPHFTPSFPKPTQESHVSVPACH